MNESMNDYLRIRNTLSQNRTTGIHTYMHMRTQINSHASTIYTHLRTHTYHMFSYVRLLGGT